MTREHNFCNTQKKVSFGTESPQAMKAASCQQFILIWVVLAFYAFSAHRNYHYLILETVLQI